MFIKSIRLETFKNFEQEIFDFSKMTLIKGSNGSGKTTLALESILFALYGFTTKELLSDLPMRSKSKSCTVEVKFEQNKAIYTVIRSFPIKLIIKKDDKIIKFNTNSEASKFLIDLVGEREAFLRFRVIDSAKESNLLEQGNVALKRIIFAGSDEIFNNMRVKLLEIKRTRELLNKDRIQASTHFPSEKRLQLISSKIEEIAEQEADLVKTIREFENDFRKTEREMGQLEQRKKTIKYNQDKVTKDKTCFVCKQVIPQTTQKRLSIDIDKEVKDINNSLATKTSEIEEMNDLIKSHRIIRENISSRLQTLFDLRGKLEARLKQKDFIYTNKDEEIVKQAIKELDNISSYYLTETIKTLTPIINSILQKIDFTVSFDVNTKGKFEINLQKDNINYKYKDLSTGQRIMLQIAFKLSLLLSQGESGILIADEGMSSLDSENLQHILQIFEGLPFQLILVLHRFDEVPDNIKVINLDKE